jgi:ribA/ribD-fused uncharacterized protein
MIRFKKEDDMYGCFSNFYNCPITYDGITYHSTEAAFQSLKCKDYEDRKEFSELTPNQSKKYGRKVDLREDWEDVKYDLMVDVLKSKFTQHPDIGEILKSTNDEEIIEDTTAWHDNIWGDCQCPRCKNKEGRNLLGKALMEVRDNLKMNNI